MGIFIVPRKSSEWKGNEAGWITASGWASAGKAIWGSSLVATADGIFDPEEVVEFPRFANHDSKQRRFLHFFFRKLIPEIIITFLKDINLKYKQPKVWPIEIFSADPNCKIQMVWERHDLFCGPGKKIADKYNVPFVISVEAPIVWEAKKWRVFRPFWGFFLEKYFEAKSISKADLVVCVSNEVRDKLIKMKISQNKIMVYSNRVDSSIFNPNINGDTIKLKYNLFNKRVIGWTGSFRRFHGLELVVSAFSEISKKYDDTLLMLLGDGQEFENIKKRVCEIGLSDKVILPGRKTLREVPFYIKNFHICLVSAMTDKGFHYSPLKLKEYMALGKPVISARVGDISKEFSNRKDILFYEAGNKSDLILKMLEVLENDKLRRDLVDNSLKRFQYEGTWVYEMNRVLKALGIE